MAADDSLRTQVNEAAAIVPVYKYGIVTQDADTLKAVAEIEFAAATNATVLVLGETGTGKELIAEAIHKESKRKGALIARNCGAIPAQLIESELFGHEKGAFTGAAKQHQGIFEQAHHGTVFLDEIGEMPTDLQTRLLRVLDGYGLERVGGRETIHPKFRLIAATNKDLRLAVEQKTFRQDLFYRLDVLAIRLKPLRERKGDVPLLARVFLESFKAKHKRPELQFSPATLKRLEQHSWPGNIRELQNIVERGVIFSEGPTIEAATLKLNIRPVFKNFAIADAFNTLATSGLTADDVKAGYCRAVAALNGVTPEGLARKLGISMRELDILLPGHREAHSEPEEPVNRISDLNPNPRP